ncbi:MAG: MFS transporter [Deltaproteobacteria bacterium]|nr:MAG: MFS transporter [Deltaproteobacteria bacterium]
MNRDPRAATAWCLYDWANSAFATVVLSAVLPVYFAAIAPPGGIPFLARTVPATAFWSYTVAASMLLVAVVAPALGSLADRRAVKKPLLIAFTLTGTLATALLVLAGRGEALLAAGLFLVANIGFAAGNIFYNAFLPDLASGSEADRLSSRAYAWGYIGGGIALALVFLLIEGHARFGIADKGTATRIGFLFTGAWWLLFALPAFRLLREGPPRPGAGRLQTPADYLRLGRELAGNRDLLRFLVAFLFYNDGIQTIIAVAAIFASVELGLDTGAILGCYLMIQFLAMPATLITGRLAERWGAKRTVLATLAVFTAITVYAATMTTTLEFWLLGLLVALVLGGSQALSRSLYASLVPPARSAEFFSFFAISTKFASILGPLLFALLIDLTGSNRLAILSLAVFFVAGIWLLAGVDVERGRTRAGASVIESP